MIFSKVVSLKVWQLFVYATIWALVGVAVATFKHEAAKERQADRSAYMHAFNQIDWQIPVQVMLKTQDVANCTSASIAKQQIAGHGLSSETPWGDSWSIESSEGKVTMTYPLANAPSDAGAYLEGRILKSAIPYEHKLTDATLSIVYRCDQLIPRREKSAT